MRQLIPQPGDIDPVTAHAALERPAPPGRPWVLLNMVSSLDGATAVSGDSGDLGGPADREVFTAIRAVPDVIVAAAGTVRADRYGPPRTPPELRAMRVERGQRPFPRIAVVSASLDLDADSPLFTEAPGATLIFTPDAPSRSDAARDGRLEALRAVAEVVGVAGERVGPQAILDHLYADGVSRVLVEGGPSLNGAFLEAGLIDELNLTVSPQIVGGPSSRVTAGAAEAVTAMAMRHLWEADGVLLGCWTRI